ncbi:MAG: prephenate dehydrogenase [Chloroflexi bacterium]|nr:prephenate dehydrogenase [Chloroflexota bacterium]
MKDLDGFTGAVVGLGLMGGSLAMALKQNGVGRRIVGDDVSPQTVARALEMGAIDEACGDIATTDLIVLAMPVRAIIAWCDEHRWQVRPDQIVMDLGSTKRDVVSQMEAMPAQCVGGHPMCGKEQSGLLAADPALFRSAKFVLVPTARARGETMDTLKQLILRIGARSVVMDAEPHDRAGAAISHLPYRAAIADGTPAEWRARLEQARGRVEGQP